LCVIVILPVIFLVRWLGFFLTLTAAVGSLCVGLPVLLVLGGLVFFFWRHPHGRWSKAAAVAAAFLAPITLAVGLTLVVACPILWFWQPQGETPADRAREDEPAAEAPDTAARPAPVAFVPPTDVKPSPLDRLDPEHIPADLRHPTQPPELVALLGTVRAWGDEVDCVACSPDGKWVASAGDRDGVRLREVATHRPGPTLEGIKGHVNALAFAPDGQRLAVAADDGVSVWAINDSSAARELVFAEPSWPEGGPMFAPQTVQFTPDGRSLIVGAERTSKSFQEKTTDQVRVWALDDDGPRLRLSLDGAGGRAVLSADGRTLATIELKQVRLWDLSGGREREWWSWPPVWDMPFRWTGRVFWSMLLLGGGCLLAGTGLAVLSRRGGVLQTPEGSPESISVYFPLAAMVAVVILVLGLLFAQRLMNRFRPGCPVLFACVEVEEPLHAVALSADGCFLALNRGDEGTIRLWRLDGGAKEIATLEGHTKSVTAMAFSPDGGLLASVSWDQTARLWSLGDEPCERSVLPLEQRSPSGGGVAFTPDGKALVAGLKA
jgi:WD40 repeat protein